MPPKKSFKQWLKRVKVFSRAWQCGLKRKGSDVQNKKVQYHLKMMGRQKCRSPSYLSFIGWFPPIDFPAGQIPFYHKNNWYFIRLELFFSYSSDSLARLASFLLICTNDSMGLYIAWSYETSRNSKQIQINWNRCDQSLKIVNILKISELNPSRTSALINNGARPWQVRI